MVNNFKMVLACSMAVITAITAQIRFNIAFIPYTMQNFGVVFSGLLLGPIYGLISQLIYIGMIAIGIPAASGFGGGIAVLWVGCCIAAIPVYLLGFVVFYYYATINAKLMSWSVKASQYFGFNLNPFWSVFVASVIIFIPQDFFVDHLIAVSVYAYVVDLLKQKGIEM